MKSTIGSWLLAAWVLLGVRPVWADVVLTNNTRDAILVRVEFLGPDGKVASIASQTIESLSQFTFVGHSQAKDHSIKLHLARASAATEDILVPARDPGAYEIRTSDNGKPFLFIPD